MRQRMSLCKMYILKNSSKSTFGERFPNHALKSRQKAAPISTINH
jgi:hypothetical protein